MSQNFTHRKAVLGDLEMIIQLLIDDELGKTRETTTKQSDQRYIDAFNKIIADPNQYLMVVEQNKEIVGTCHLTIMPSVTFIGSTRMQIEAVRVSSKFRSQNIGTWMINAAIEYGRSQGATIIQLTTNKKRLAAKKFYEDLDFKATHEGMKLYLDS
ncbi:MAG: GNAT family N-acetyltransferase [Rickettsiaceae bacterium]|nr:GNAT family N-acetyltransferase [Rickettsiaceae bacterium]